MNIDESTLVQMGREYPDIGPGAVAERLRDIAKRARKHERMCERYCNESDFDPSLIDRLESGIPAAVDVLFPGTRVIFQRDPRGATVKLLPPSGATNDWGREGLCVLA